ncbi:MAG TPA: hypothetical protein DCP57_08075 [Gammaproteobacteria bacterium]|jgi:hypothetical protein|nr:MAG: hypothetical protein EVA67_09225 [OM182 bacterium]HAL42388.1 hypothetical protein [Gammaproteobacteria bacterium]|tara:strand:- start:12883 stop:13368 length:486 start_codon:yes stop_codon:yes gene_type:complete
MRIIITAFFLVTSSVVLADHHSAPAPSGIASLAWMTGSWSGPIGPGATLEENWTIPEAGSMASLVRSIGPEGTRFVEIVSIDEVEGDMTLHLQQWRPGFVPLGPAQAMKRVSQTDQRIDFEAVSPGGLKALGYSRQGDTFNVHITTAEDQQMTIVLNKVAR